MATRKHIKPIKGKKDKNLKKKGINEFEKIPSQSIVKKVLASNWILDILIYIILLFIAFIILYPNYVRPPQRDSGAFLYIGQQILNGYLPYIDLWDHKGPVVHLLNALGLFLANGKFIGVWGLQLAFTFSTSAMLFHISKKITHWFPAFIASIVFLIGIIDLNEGGNETEQWVLLFHALALYLFYKYMKCSSSSGFIYLLICGLFSGLAFLLRQNLIGPWIAIGAYFMYKTFVLKARERVQAIRDLSFILLGAILVLTANVLFWIQKGAFEQYFDQTFRFNFTYSGSGIFDKMLAMLSGFDNIPVAAFSISAIFLVALYYFTRQKVHIVVYIALCMIFVEFFLTSIAGKATKHYYLTWLPGTTILIAFTIHSLKKGFQKAFNVSSKKMMLLINAWVLFSFIFISYQPINNLVANYKGINEIVNDNWYRKIVVKNIVENTKEGDYVLHWGMVGSLNFLSGRKSPTKYFYQYALNTKGYTTEKHFYDFYNELIRNKPKLIIDASNDENLPPLDKKKREKWEKKTKKEFPNRELPENAARFFKFVESNYTKVGNVGYMVFYVAKD